MKKLAAFFRYWRFRRHLRSLPYRINCSGPMAKAVLAKMKPLKGWVPDYRTVLDRDGSRHNDGIPMPRQPQQEQAVVPISRKRPA